MKVRSSGAKHPHNKIQHLVLQVSCNTNATLLEGINARNQIRRLMILAKRLTKRVKKANENCQEEITKEEAVFVESFCF